MSIAIGGQLPDGLAINGQEIKGIANNGRIIYEKLEYIQNGLLLHLDSINNTGNGHSNTATIWTDISGNGNNGTLHGGLTWNSDNLSFDGVNGSYVSTPLVLSALGNQFTITTRVFMRSFNNYRGIGGNHAGSPGLVFGQWEDDQLIFAVHPNPSVSVPKSTINLNQYNQFTLRVNNTKVEVFINGEKRYEKTGSAFTTMASNLMMLVGCALISTGRYLLGQMNNFMVYNRALTDSEIKNNFDTDENRFSIA